MTMTQPYRRSIRFKHKERRPSVNSDSPGLSPKMRDAKPGDDSDGGVWVDGDSAEPPPEVKEYEKKKQNFIVRTIWTLAMIGGFFLVMAMGHIWLVLLITIVQVITFKEVIAIASVPSKERKIMFTKSLNWYFLVTTIYFLYGESVIYYFKHILLVDAYFGPMAAHHRFISFMLYILGFVFFVATLKKGHYKFQFTQFAWTHMALYLVVVQAHFIMNNIFEGMIWFFIPVSMVITNDVFAYICGITFGKTPLIKLSPKKTVEGFIGAWICTIIIGLGITNFLMQFPYFVCPVKDLGANAWTGLECQPLPAFIPRTFDVPRPLHPFVGQTFTCRPIQFHMLAMATFASLIAPFGGFFASGLKRSFKIKDFGNTIPGHGGITDRMDCQYIMGFFAYMYYHSFIATNRLVTVGGVLQNIIGGLSEAEQVEVLQGLQKYLVGQGVVSEKIHECWSDAVRR